MKQNYKLVFTFLGITILMSALFDFLIIHTGMMWSGLGLNLTGLMWSPGLAAIITSLLFKRDLNLIGWKWGKTRYQTGSVLVPLLYVTITYVIIWLVGWGGFPNPERLQKITTSFGFEALPVWLTVLIYCILAVIYCLPDANALGEEIGWRGFLVPILFKELGYTKTSFIVGIIWAVWHYPILLYTDYNSNTPAWYGLTCFTVGVIATSFISTWFRIKSGNIWTATLIHATHNLSIQLIFTPFTIVNEKTKYYIDEFGAVLPIVIVFFAIYFWTRRKELAYL